MSVFVTHPSGPYAAKSSSIGLFHVLMWGSCRCHFLGGPKGLETSKPNFMAALLFSAIGMFREGLKNTAGDWTWLMAGSRLKKWRGNLLHRGAPATHPRFELKRVKGRPLTGPFLDLGPRHPIGLAVDLECLILPSPHSNPLWIHRRGSPMNPA